jgi:hypothetical protein
MTTGDWAQPLRPIAMAAEAWEEPTPEDDRDALGEGTPAEPLAADVEGTSAEPSVEPASEEHEPAE